MILSCGPSSRAPSPTTLEKTVWRANRTCTLEAKNIRDLLGFRNYYSWTLLPESAIGPTITSVYFFIDSMTALVLVDFNCVSDQRLYNIYTMFLLERLFSSCRKNHFEDDLFSQVPLSGSQTGLTGLHENEATPRKASPKLARSFQFQDGRDSR